VGWVNNDVELDPEWLAVLRRALDADPQLAGVQPIILAPDRRVDGAGIDISSGRFLQAAHRAALSDPRKPAWGISATASLYRTAALRASAIGGEILHPAFFAYYEDVELCARLRATGWTMEVVERPLAIHAGSSTAPSLGRLATRLRTRNRYWVWRLWKVGRLAALLLEDARLIARDLISVRAGEAAVRCAAILAGLFAAPRGKVM
jgi:GT2 family glycosyltransferase